MQITELRLPYKSPPLSSEKIDFLLQKSCFHEKPRYAEPVHSLEYLNWVEKNKSEWELLKSKKMFDTELSNLHEEFVKKFVPNKAKAEIGQLMQNPHFPSSNNIIKELITKPQIKQFYISSHEWKYFYNRDAIKDCLFTWIKDKQYPLKDVISLLHFFSDLFKPFNKVTPDKVEFFLNQLEYSYNKKCDQTLKETLATAKIWHNWDFYELNFRNPSLRKPSLRNHLDLVWEWGEFGSSKAAMELEELTRKFALFQLDKESIIKIVNYSNPNPKISRLINEDVIKNLNNSIFETSPARIDSFLNEKVKSEVKQLCIDREYVLGCSEEEILKKQKECNNFIRKTNKQIEKLNKKPTPYEVWLKFKAAKKK